MTWKIFLILILLLCFAGAEIKNSGNVSEEELLNITNRIFYESLNISSKMNEEFENTNNSFITRAVYKYADFLSFIFIEGAKETINYGYEHPQYNYSLAWKLLFVTLFASLIIPSLYILLFIGYFIKKIVDYIKRRKK